MKNKNQHKDNKWIYISISILFLLFLIKLADKSQMIWEFPLDKDNDMAGYMARLYFLSSYGLHGYVPNWYNGIILGNSFPIGWYYFTLPLFYLLGKVELATYLSIILIYALAFYFVNVLGKKENLSIAERSLFFLLLFANPVALSVYLRLGSLQALFGWLIFIPYFTLLIRYIDKKLDYMFLIFIPLYGLLLISYPPIFILASLFLLAYFLIKSWKERFYLFICMLLTSVLTAFWWYPFILHEQQSLITQYQFLHEFGGQWIRETIASIALSLTLIITFLFYWFSVKKNSRILYFFLPSLIIAPLVATKLIRFLPFLNKIYVSVYSMFFIFQICYFFFKTNYPQHLKKLIRVILVLLPIAFFIISMAFTPAFIKHTERDNNIISLLSNVKEKVLIVGDDIADYPYYAYGAIYYNTSTPRGWDDYAPSKDLILKIITLRSLFSNKDCNEITSTFNWLNTTNMISYGNGCDTLELCGFNKVEVIGDACLYKLSKS